MSDPRPEPPAEEPAEPPLWLEPPPPPPPDPAPWGLSGALMLPVAAYGGQLILAVAIGGVAALMLTVLQPGLADRPDELRQAAITVAVLPVALASTLLTLGLVYASIVLACGRPLLASLRLKRPSRRGVALCLVLGAGISLAYVGVAALAPPAEEDELGGPLSDLAESGPLGHALWIFLALAVAPAVEEILFRGYVYLGARGRLGPLGAGTMVTLLFAGLHIGETGLYWPALAGIGLMAALLAWIMERTGNLSYCIATHLGYNGALALLTLLGGNGVGS